MATITRISSLTPYNDAQIKGVDYLPIITPSVGATPFATFRASGEQIARYASSTITNQQLSSTSDVVFNTVNTSTLSTVYLTATDITIKGLPAVAKYSFEINHIGSSNDTAYSVSHPISSEDVMVQIFEKKVNLSGTVRHEMVLASTSHLYNPTTGSTLLIDITNTLNATYKVIIIG